MIINCLFYGQNSTSFVSRLRYIDSGDSMKNLIAAVFAVILAIGIGCLFMKTSATDEEIKTVMNSSGQLKAFQIGAYSSVDAANESALAVNGTVEYDGTYYYVYASILSDSQNIEHMINYLNENNIYYYVKNITASEAFKNELYKYEELMKSTVSDVAFLELNEKILDLYEEA